MDIDLRRILKIRRRSLHLFGYSYYILISQCKIILNLRANPIKKTNSIPAIIEFSKSKKFKEKSIFFQNERKATTEDALK